MVNHGKYRAAFSRDNKHGETLDASESTSTVGPIMPRDSLRSRRSHKLFMRKSAYIFLAALLILLGSGLGVYYWLNDSKSQVVIPTKYAEQVLFSLYVPNKIPRGYGFDTHNFEVKDGSVLLFKLNDSAGDSIIFAEQAAPSGFDFNSFYQQYMTGTLNLQGVPYKSVTGDITNSDNKLLSITANGTWLLITAPRSTSNSTLYFIADHVVRQD
jgi:hypothetical protein